MIRSISTEQGQRTYAMSARQMGCILSLTSLLLMTACGRDGANTETTDMMAPVQNTDANVTPDAIAAPVDGAVSDSATPINAWHEDCPVDEREQRMIEVGEVRLNVACRGSGPTIVFLHGFPEFHYGWHPVMDLLAEEFRLVAPDQRGYNLSDKPAEVDAYALPKLTDDILRLLPLVSREPVILVAHDWGGPVGWLVAHTPDAHIRGFISTNGPHPLRFAALIANDPAQQMASSYMNLFRSPTAEAVMTPAALAQQFNFLSADDLAIYREAWNQPGAITGGLNW